MKLELRYGKYLEYYLKQNVRIRHFFLLNSANVALLLSTISDTYAKMDNQDSADHICLYIGVYLIISK